MRESLRPIEPGCLVLVRPYDRPLFTARVDSAASFDSCDGHETWWLKECPMPGEHAACECALTRIDPDDDQRERFEREERLNRASEHMSDFMTHIARRMREMER